MLGLQFSFWLNCILEMRTACSTQEVSIQECYTVEKWSLMPSFRCNFLSCQVFCLLSWFPEFLLKFLSFSIASNCLQVFSSIPKLRFTWGSFCSSGQWGRYGVEISQLWFPKDSTAYLSSWKVIVRLRGSWNDLGKSLYYPVILFLEITLHLWPQCSLEPFLDSFGSPVAEQLSVFIIYKP